MLLELEDLVLEATVMGNDELRAFGRGFGDGVRHHVRDRLVAQVSDTGDDGYMQACHGKGDGIVIEDEQVCLGPSAPDDDDGIIFVFRFIYLMQSGDEVIRVVLSLNPCEIVIEMKPVSLAFCLEAVHEIFEARG